MTRAIIRLPRAEEDIIGCYAYLGEHASEATADRFLASVEETLGLIARSLESVPSIRRTTPGSRAFESPP